MKTQGLRGGVLLRRVVFSTPRMSRNCLVLRWRLNNKLNITWLLGDMKLPFECKKKNISLSFNALITLEILVNT